MFTIVLLQFSVIQILLNDYRFASLNVWLVPFILDFHDMTIFSFCRNLCNIFLIMFVICMYILTVSCSLEKKNVNRRFGVFTWLFYVNIFIFIYRKCNSKVCHYLPLFKKFVHLCQSFDSGIILSFFCWRIKICFLPLPNFLSLTLL